jgi:hypothetical protein
MMKKHFLYLALLCLLLLAGEVAGAATYHLTATGAGVKDGTTLAAAFSPAEVSTITFQPDDIILVYDDAGDLTGTSAALSATFTMLLKGDGTVGHPITIKAAPGETPVFSGLTTYTADWTEESANVWYHAIPNNGEVGFVLFGGLTQANASNQWKNAKANLAANKDYFTDTTNSRIYVYADADPATKWGNVSMPTNYGGFWSSAAGTNDYWLIEGLTLKYYNYNAIRFETTVGTIIRNNNISWTGGGRAGSVRAGNGIQVDTGSSATSISGNTISQIYDAGVTYQSFDATTVTTGTISDNNISLCGGGVEYNTSVASTGGATNGSVYGNRITNMGSGWSGFAAWNAAGNNLHGAGIIISGAADSPVSGISVYKNVIDGFTYRGINYSQVNGTNDIYANEIKNGAPTATGIDGTNMGGIVVHGGNFGDATNDAYGSVYANVVHTTSSHGILGVNGQTATLYANNVIANCGDDTTYHSMFSSTNTADTWENNIAYASTTGSRCFVDSSTTVSTVDYNICLTNGTNKYKKSTTEYTTLALWRTGSSQSANDLYADPLFLDAANGDFRVKANSPAINAGAVIAGYHDQATPATDFAGALVINLPPDIGAYDHFANGTREHPYWVWSDYTWTGHNLRTGASVFYEGDMGSLDISGLTDSNPVLTIGPAPGKTGTVTGFVGDGSNSKLQSRHGWTIMNY